MCVQARNSVTIVEKCVAVNVFLVKSLKVENVLSSIIFQMFHIMKRILFVYHKSLNLEKHVLICTLCNVLAIKTCKWTRIHMMCYLRFICWFTK